MPPAPKITTKVTIDEVKTTHTPRDMGGGLHKIGFNTRGKKSPPVSPVLPPKKEAIRDSFYLTQGTIDWSQPAHHYRHR